MISRSTRTLSDRLEIHSTNVSWSKVTFAKNQMSQKKLISVILTFDHEMMLQSISKASQDGQVDLEIIRCVFSNIFFIVHTFIRRIITNL